MVVGDFYMVGAALNRKAGSRKVANGKRKKYGKYLYKIFAWKIPMSIKLAISSIPRTVREFIVIIP